MAEGIWIRLVPPGGQGSELGVNFVASTLHVQSGKHIFQRNEKEGRAERREYKVVTYEYYNRCELGSLIHAIIYHNTYRYNY